MVTVKTLTVTVRKMYDISGLSYVAFQMTVTKSDTIVALVQLYKQMERKKMI